MKKMMSWWGDQIFNDFLLRSFFNEGKSHVQFVFKFSHLYFNWETTLESWPLLLYYMEQWLERLVLVKVITRNVTETKESSWKWQLIRGWDWGRERESLSQRDLLLSVPILASIHNWDRVLFNLCFSSHPFFHASQ